MKRFDKKAISTMMKAESERRSSESFFSSKTDNENYFGSVKGNPLKVVGLENIPANGDIRSFNVVKFSDGHQMSTGKFFSAKGLLWPVGGNTQKLAYLASALENDINIEVTPEDVKVTPMKRNDGTYVGARGADGKTTVEKDEKKALQAVTYYFAEQELPKISLVDFSAE